MQLVVVKLKVGTTRMYRRLPRKGYVQMDITTASRTNGRKLQSEEGEPTAHTTASIERDLCALCILSDQAYFLMAMRTLIRCKKT